jgi:hypothetical protein
MEMTPYNLVNMAKLLGYDIIALTDHNTCGNCAAAIRAGEEAGLAVVPGMELCTAEEIHTVCLFPDLASAEAFSAYVYTTLPPIQNDPAVYGRQVKTDHLDQELGEEPLLLVLASGISISEVPALVKLHGGACYPAHIDRASYSVISQLGVIDETMGFRCAEVSDRGDPAALTAQFPALQNMRIIRSSDAHYLENMREPADYLHPEECSAKALVAQLTREG